MTVISKSMFPLASGIRNITQMKERYDALQTQLASGKKAANLAEMGTDRYFDLALRQRMARIDSYQNNVKSVTLRLNVLDTTMTRLQTIESDSRAAAMSGGGATAALNYQTTPTLAASRLDETLTLLNVDVAGRYLFGGSNTETKPVEDPLTILEGAGGRAGFRTIVTQRKAADLGADHLGRLAISTASDTSTLAEDGAHPFGIKLSNVSTSTADISVTGPSGSPQQLSVQFGATLPTAGQTVTLGFTLPDQTEEQVVLTATTNDPPSEGEFLIGADAATTAANFSAAMGVSLTRLAEGKMVAASAFAAADNFFNGQSEVPQRVDGPPYETATALVDATPDDTVFWYRGEDSTDPRNTVTARVGEGTSVGYGVQANEAGFVQLIRSQAAMAVQVFNGTDTATSDRFTAMVSRNTSRLTASTNGAAGSMQIVSVELGLAKSTTGAVQEQHTAHNAQLGNMLEDIEAAPTETIAMEILALKTRLEASYQVTAMLSQLSLVNYLK